jgi:hypothetical protein
MFDRFRHRSYELENLDKGTYTPEEYEGCIVELQRVNEWLGDSRALRNTLLKEIERQGLPSWLIIHQLRPSGRGKQVERHRWSDWN